MNKSKFRGGNVWVIISLCLIALAYTVTSLLFRYEDIVSYTTWSVDFWDLFFEGRIDEFYEYTQLNIRGAAHSVFSGSWLTIFPWLIWNLPLYLTHPISSMPHVDSMACILWSKLFLVLCVIGVGIYVYKIVLLITKDKENSLFAAILASGGGELLNCVAYAGQDEVVYLLFFLIAVYELLRNKKKWFLLWSCLSVTVCPIMLIPFLAVLLFYEKKLLKIIGSVIFVCIPTVLFELAYMGDKVYQAVKGINTSAVFGKMLEGDMIDTAVGVTSVSGIALVILFYICYASKFDDGAEKNEYALWQLSGAFFIICFLMPPNTFYRFCLYIPFWAITMALERKNRNMNMFLLTVISYIRLFIALGYSADYNMNSRYLMPEIIGLHNIPQRYVAETISQSGYDTIYLIIRPVLFAAAIILLMNTHPKKTKEVNFEIPYQISLLAYSGLWIVVLAAFAVCVFGR